MTPTCYGANHEAGCPYDVRNNKAMTAQKCGAHYSDCQCKFNSGALPSSIYTNYPSTEPGKYKDKEFVSLYGTSCAAWDSIPGTPWFESSCKNTTTAQLQTKEKTWCAGQWCYVEETCPTGVSTDVFKGSTEILGSRGDSISLEESGFLASIVSRNRIMSCPRHFRPY